MTAAVLAATRRLGTLRPWRLERARFALDALAGVAAMIALDAAVG
jgi:hypothetical protein